MTDPGLRHLQDALTLDDAARDRPDEQFIADMEMRYETEREFAALLTRKQRRRLLPRTTTITLDEMTSCLRAFLSAHVDDAFALSDVRWLAGGGSKIQVAFALDWTDPQQGPTRTKMAARMEPQESLSATSRRREAGMLRMFAGTLPVPRVFWVDEDGSYFPEPTLIYAFAEGVAKPTEAIGRPGGVGSDFGPRLRPLLGLQFVQNLATMHSFNAQTAEDAFDLPRVGATDSALWQLNRARRLWDEDRGQDFPLLEVAGNWLGRNLPILDRVSALHGDYRTGNFLFDEESGTVTAILDWERSYLGDRHRDLAWTLLPQFGTRADDGSLLVSGLIPADEFLQQYQALSGLHVDPETLRYYRILNSYQLIASTMGTAFRVVRLGRSHQDVLLAWIEGLVYPVAEDLRLALHEAGI